MCMNHPEKPANCYVDDHFACTYCQENVSFNGEDLDWDFYKQEKIEEFVDDSIEKLSQRNNEIAELV